MNKKFIAGISILSLLVGLSGCSTNNESATSGSQSGVENVQSEGDNPKDAAGAVAAAYGNLMKGIAEMDSDTVSALIDKQTESLNNDPDKASESLLNEYSEALLKEVPAAKGLDTSEMTALERYVNISSMLLSGLYLKEYTEESQSGQGGDQSIEFDIPKESATVSPDGKTATIDLSKATANGNKGSGTVNFVFKGGKWLMVAPADADDSEDTQSGE